MVATGVSPGTAIASGTRALAIAGAEQRKRNAVTQTANGGVLVGMLLLPTSRVTLQEILESLAIDQHGAIVLHPGNDRACPLEASPFGGSWLFLTVAQACPRSPSC